MIWNLEKFGDATAVVTDDGKSVSYAELKSLTDAWAAKVPRRSLVFLLVDNSLPSLVAYVACMNHDIVPLMLNSKIDAGMIEQFVDIYHPFRVYDCAKGVATDVSEASPKLHSELALLITTSGSTGSPKLVRQSYENIRSNAESIAEYLKLDASERPITTLPMNYVYGLSIINSHLLVGATLLLTNCSIMERSFWTFFTQQGATSFGGVPYTYEMLDRLMFFRRKLPSLRTMTQAGGKITPELHKKFAEYAQKENKNFVVMYGAAEATSRMGYLPPERALDKVGSMGIAIPGGRLTLVDEKGVEIETPNTVGELVFRGPNVTLGYAECAADLVKGDERLGRYETGDMAKIDADGYFFIVGRKKRFLKIFGNRVSLDETERLVKGEFPNLECACTGRDDHMRVYVTDRTMLADVQKCVSCKTGLNASAFEVMWLESIPKNSSGKTLYSCLD